MSSPITRREDLVESIMITHVYCVDAADDLLSAIRIMFSRRCSCVVVADKGQVCGILTERDVVRLSATHSKTLGQLKVADAMTCPVISIPPDTSLIDAACMMSKHRCRRFPVVAGDGSLVGLITQSDIISSAKRALEQHSHRLEREVEARTRSLEFANARLAELAITDPLTGLYNRRFLYEHIEQQAARLQRNGGHLACIMIDIDHFKKVNDTCGHECGDEVLSRLARVMCSVIRPYDVVARYGGEEFLIVMDADESAAANAAERVREVASTTRFRHGNNEFNVTISAGVACRGFPAIDYKADRLIADSDAALYAAKNNGRNRIMRASQLASSEYCMQEKSPAKNL